MIRGFKKKITEEKEIICKFNSRALNSSNSKKNKLFKVTIQRIYKEFSTLADVNRHGRNSLIDDLNEYCYSPSDERFYGENPVCDQILQNIEIEFRLMSDSKIKELLDSLNSQ